jgi:ABC-type taurine transport system ATPase subunit
MTCGPAARPHRLCLPGTVPDPFLDVTDNVALLPMLAGMPNAQARSRALELLTALDVQHRAKAMPSQLSGASSSAWPCAAWSTTRR